MRHLRSNRELMRKKVNPPAGLHTGHHSRCPGGATQPAPDKSNPRIEDPSLCNPKDDVGAG